jgi:hypothetical protein
MYVARISAHFHGRSLSQLLLLRWFAEDDITFERVIGPEFPGKYKHPATIAEFQNGDLYIAYYSGTGEYEQDTRCYGMRLAKGAREWSRPEIIADTP